MLNGLGVPGRRLGFGECTEALRFLWGLRGVMLQAYDKNFGLEILQSAPRDFDTVLQIAQWTLVADEAFTL